MEPREERFTRPELGGVRLRALHWGSSGDPALVLLHGGGANAHWWDHLATSLAGTFHVVALDFRGHGASDHPEEIRAGAFAEDLAALLTQLEDAGGPPASDAFLVGHSLGAHVAAVHAASAPIRGLVLIDPARGASRTHRRATRLALTLRPTYARRAEALANFRFLPEARAEESLRRAIAEHSVRQEPDGRYGYDFDPRWFSVEPAGRPDFTKIRCPTLVLRGATSTLLTAAGAARIAAEIPDARLVEIAGAGHHVQLDRPEETLRAMQEFLVF